MREVSIEGGGYCIPKLRQAVLRGAAADSARAQLMQLLCWGKVGRVLRRQVLPGQQHEDAEDDAELHVRCACMAAACRPAAIPLVGPLLHKMLLYAAHAEGRVGKRWSATCPGLLR